MTRPAIQVYCQIPVACTPISIVAEGTSNLLLLVLLVVRTIWTVIRVPFAAETNVRFHRPLDFDVNYFQNKSCSGNVIEFWEPDSWPILYYTDPPHGLRIYCKACCLLPSSNSGGDMLDYQAKEQVGFLPDFD